MSRARLVAPLALFVLGLVAPARAWDSICYRYDDPTAAVGALNGEHDRGCEGPWAARGRWRDPVHHLDEHRVLLLAAMQRAGLPGRATETIALTIFTSGGDVDATLDGSERIPTVRPQPLDDRTVVAAQARAFAIDELAQLPDFSFSLHDWATGNETCPIPELAATTPAVRCHAFQTHMGAVNASHFSTQAADWHAWLHHLATTRADECRAMHAAAWGRVPAGERAAFEGRWAAFFRECEAEALALEAVAQHHLQDAWSSGHMWERWGSSTLRDFPPTASAAGDADATAWNMAPIDMRRLFIAEITAIFSGTIHGSDGPIFETTPGLSDIALGDPICYPHDAALSALRPARDTDPFPVAGDMHLHDVLGDADSLALFGVARETLHDSYVADLLPVTSPGDLASHRGELLACVASSVREVYDRLADPTTYGDPALGAATGPAPAPFDPARCFGMRVRNHTFAAGFDGVWQARAAEGRGVAIGDVPSDIDAQAAFDYQRAWDIARALDQVRPDGTEGAQLNLTATVSYTEWVSAGPMAPPVPITRTFTPEVRTMLGVMSNDHYSTPPGAPPAAYADPELPWADGGSAPLAAGPELDLVSTFHRAHADYWCGRFDDAALSALHDRAVASVGLPMGPVACSHCVEVVQRHVRAGGATSLCDAVRPGSAFIDRPTAADGPSGAREYCGCDQLPVVIVPVAAGANFRMGLADYAVPIRVTFAQPMMHESIDARILQVDPSAPDGPRIPLQGGLTNVGDLLLRPPSDFGWHPGVAGADTELWLAIPGPGPPPTTQWIFGNVRAGSVERERFVLRLTPTAAPGTALRRADGTPLGAGPFELPFTPRTETTSGCTPSVTCTGGTQWCCSSSRCVTAYACAIPGAYDYGGCECCSGPNPFMPLACDLCYGAADAYVFDTYCPGG